MASDGKEAIDWLKAHGDTTDIVLMDVQMPVMNGYEATRQIRCIPALSELPIVALTAGAFLEQQELASQAGMTSFISKPFNVDAAIALIIKLTGHVVPAVPASASAPAVAAVGDAGELPGISRDKGMAIWRDAAHYKKILRRFADEYGAVTTTLGTLDRAAAEALVHKFKGAAANLALTEVPTRAAEVEAALRAHADPSEKIAQLQFAMDVVLNTIKRYAPGELPAAGSAIHAENPSQLGSLLNQLLQSWDSNSTEAVRQAMACLAPLLDGDQLASVQAALEVYDFQAGAAATRDLINTLHNASGNRSCPPAHY